MQRRIFGQLYAWKERSSHKPLLLEGARQVGKTWIMQNFGKEAFENTIYISCDRHSSVHEIFAGDFNIQRILRGLEAYQHTNITPGKTLIIFDEIQENPTILASLKYFCEEMPQLHIMAAGSFLGVALNHRQISFPVGKVEFLTVYPLSFYEFLDALGEERLRKILEDADLALASAFKNKLEDYLKQYFMVGGMPEAVSCYRQNQHLSEVREIQQNLIQAYEKDFTKYIEPYDAKKIYQIWHSLPDQLAKENSKFIYRQIAPGARAAQYEDAMMWLNKTGMVYAVKKISLPELPLSAYVDHRNFKLYLLDIGLLCALHETPLEFMIGEKKLFNFYQGTLTEQYVLQQLKCSQKASVYYWASRTAEVDFIIQQGSGVLPIEVKAGINLKAKSLKIFREKYHPEKAMRTSLADFKVHDGLYDIPLYLLESLDKVLDLPPNEEASSPT